jgi:hypothetical protein
MHAGVVEPSGLSTDELEWLALGGIGNRQALLQQAMPPPPELKLATHVVLEPVRRIPQANLGACHGLGSFHV